MSDSPSPTFCVIPWTHVFADEQGLMRPCCMAVTDRSKPNVDDQGQPLVIYKQGSLEAGWNSTFMKTMRLDMLAGRRPPVCEQCFRDEDLSIRSYRQDANVTLGAHIPEAVAATAPDGASPLELVTSADLRLGNQCNLKCRMCSPLSSKLLIPEWRQLFALPDDHAELLALERVDWFDSDGFWSNCEQIMPQLEKLHFAGGEPMIIARMLDFLQRTVDAGHASSIVLSYVTNMTTLPERVTTLWPAFRDVRITASLDGFDTLNTYIRFPSKWDRIDDNLTRLVSDPAYNCSKVTVNTTVQAYNVLRLDELFEYLFGKFPSALVPYPRLTLLEWPAPFSVRVLPSAVKEMAAARLRAFVDRWQNRWPLAGDELDRFLSSIAGVVDHMMGAEREADRAEFVRRTRIYDASRGQSVAAIVPELGPMFAPPAAPPALPVSAPDA